MEIIKQALDIAPNLPVLGAQIIAQQNQDLFRNRIALLAISVIASPVIASVGYSYLKEIAERLSPPSPQPNVQNTQCAPCSGEDAKKLQQCEIAKNLCNTRKLNATIGLQNCQKQLNDCSDQVELQQKLNKQLEISVQNTQGFKEKCAKKLAAYEKK